MPSGGRPTRRYAGRLDFPSGIGLQPYSWQGLIGERTTYFAERSFPLDGFAYGGRPPVPSFNRDRDAGLMLHGFLPRRLLEWQVALASGNGPNRWPPPDAGLLYSARLVASPLGPIPLDEVDLAGGGPRFSLGASANLNDLPAYDSLTGARDGGTRDLRFGGEARFAFAGLLVAGELFWAGAASTGAAGTVTTTRWGFYLEANYVIPALHLVPGARVSRLDPDAGSPGDVLTSLEALVAFLLPAGESEGRRVDLGHTAKTFASYQVTLDAAGAAVVHTAIAGAQLAF